MSVQMGVPVTLRASVVGSIARISNTAFTMDLPVKLKPNDRINVESALFEELNLKGIKLKRSGVPAVYLENRIYSNRINFVGLDAETAQKIRVSVANIRKR